MTIHVSSDWLFTCSSRLLSLTQLFTFQVFDDGSAKPVFYVASRGHHADIGGLTPGSMPPMSQTLEDEGAAFYSFKLVIVLQFHILVLTTELIRGAHI